jgi:hypothetical protein
LTSSVFFERPPQGASTIEDGFEGEKMTVGIVRQ